MQFPVTTYPDSTYHVWSVFVSHDATLAYGKAFTGMLVSQASPQAAKMDLATTVTVERSLSSTEPIISDDTPKVGQTLLSRQAPGDPSA